MSTLDTQRSACPPGEDLSAYADGELSDAVGKAISEHLTLCACCQARLEELVRTDSGLRRQFESAARELKEAEAFRRAASPVASRRRLLVGIGLAAGVLAAVALLYALLSERIPSRPDRVAVERPSQGAPEAGDAQVVFQPSAGSLRADTLSLALAGDVDARIQISRLNLADVVVRTRGETGSPSAAVPTIEEMFADRQRFAALAQRVMGAER